MKQRILLLILTCSAAFGAVSPTCQPQQMIVNGLSATMPNVQIQKGESLLIATSALAGYRAVATITDDGVVPQKYLPTGVYSGAITGFGTQFLVTSTTEDLLGHNITVKWSSGSTPTITVCTVPQMAHIAPMLGASISSGTSVTSLTSGPLTTANKGGAWYAYFVAAGDTPMSDWIPGSGFYLVDGATTAHSALAFGYFDGPQEALTTTMSWTGVGLHTYSILQALEVAPESAGRL